MLSFNVVTSLICSCIFLSDLNPLYGTLVDCPQTNKLFEEIRSKFLAKPLSTPFAAPESIIYKNIPHKTPIIVIVVLILF